MKEREDKQMRKACRALAEAVTETAIPPVVETLVQDWRAAYEQLTDSLPPLNRLLKPNEFRDWLLGEMESGGDRGGLAERVEARLAALERVAREASQPGTWADRWRLDRPRLDRAEADRRIAQVRKSTAGSARSSAEAIRRVLAARREQGVSLYQTYAVEARDRYLSAAAEAELGLKPKASDIPSTGRPPWGMFRVRGHTDAKVAAALFPHFPPFPARSELLQPGVIRPRAAAPENPPAPGPATPGTNGETRSDFDREGGDL